MISIKNTIEQFDSEIIEMVLEEYGSIDTYIERLDNTETAGLIWGSLCGFSVREQKTMILRFGLLNGIPKSLEEVADIMGTTRERIRRIESKVLRRGGCRIHYRKKLTDYLEDG